MLVVMEDNDGMDAVSQWRTRIEQVLIPRSAATPRLGGESDTSSVLQWLSHEESRVLVQHWVVDLGGAKFGRLALLPPSEGCMFSQLSPGHAPSWLVKKAGSTFIIFNDYQAVGIARCSWGLIRENLAAMAAIDGNGCAVVSPELTGVVTVDLEVDDDSFNYEIMAWGDLVAI
jgi:hypothetical protein